ncbi:MAG TPA: hypothetical protein VGJ12_00630 [Gemmatimonadaceae bacterium]
MIDRIITGLALGAVLVSCFASPSAAQMRVELGATIGYYSPMGSFQPVSIYSVGLPRSPSSLSGTALGGELRLWLVPRLGVEIAASTTGSSVGGGSTPNGYHSSVPARVDAGTAQLLVRVTGDDNRTRVWFGAGAAAIRHGGDAYEIFGKPVNYGGVVGLGSAFRITGALNATLGLSTMIYNIDFRGSRFAPVEERGTQVDMMLRTGVSVRWP